MDSQTILSVIWPILVYGTVVYAVSLFTRYLLERFLPPAITNDLLWGEVVLASIPVLYGALLAMPPYMSSFPWPMNASGFGIRVFIGAFTGFFSGWIYRIVKAFLQKFTGVDLADAVGDTPAQDSPLAGKLEQKK